MREIIAVLRGGPSSEYEISLRSGAHILEQLDKERYEARDIFIDRSGVWYKNGIPMLPDKALGGVDVVFNALHGEYGEDGKVQRLLERLSIPYTGSRAVSSSLAFNKYRTKEALKDAGVRMPLSVLVRPEGDTEELALRLFRSFPHPAMVKPVRGGSSVGMTLANNFNTLRHALGEAARISPEVLLEEYIKGREGTVGVIDSFRNEDTYALMPIEIIPPKGRSFFDYDSKYSGATIERVPSHFSDQEKKALSNTARSVHKTLGLSHYSRSDFIVSSRGIYFLEVNTLPGLTKESLLPKALNAVGTTFSDFLHHVISLAKGVMNKKRVSAI